jgi:choline dehydrogenase-like flavoprotein
MIEELGTLGEDIAAEADLAVVGAGPAGIVVALEAARHGHSVVLIESGSRSFDPAVQDLSEAAAWDRHRHAPLSLAVRRQVGGTSVIWGGRCVPFDPVDFAQRSFPGVPAWPVGYETMSGYFGRACDWMMCGRAVFSASGIPGLPPGIVPGFVDGDVLGSSLERWSVPTNFGRTYEDQLERSPRIRLLTGVTCTEIVCPRHGGRARHLECRTHAGGRIVVTAEAFVVACGGLEGTRLLMSSAGPDGEQLGNRSGHLGRWYMAHVEGSIANVRFSTPPRQTVYGYERDIDGVYVRRRFSFPEPYQLAHNLPNVVGWLGNPEIPDARHGSGQLSFVYLALTSPLGPRFAPEAQRLALTGAEIPGTPYGGATVTSRGSHLRNVVRQPFSTGRFMFDFGARRFLSRGRRIPGFFVYNAQNVYPFQYHGEQLPNPNSAVSLSGETDSLGRRRLAIDLRFSPADVDGIVRAHEHWDAYLRKLGVGWLEYPHRDIGQAVQQRLGGGFHQIGTTRMAASASHGVVDPNLAVHGVPNLYVASSSVFVTSGQANSTFMVVAFALRLADHLTRQLGVPTCGYADDAQARGERRSSCQKPLEGDHRRQSQSAQLLPRR